MSILGTEVLGGCCSDHFDAYFMKASQRPRQRFQAFPFFAVSRVLGVIPLHLGEYDVCGLE